MALSVSDRGLLERTIEKVIEGSPSSIVRYRAANLKSSFMVENETDFFMGMFWGQAVTSFASVFYMSNDRAPDVDEIKDMQIVFQKRVRDIRDAIMKAG